LCSSMWTTIQKRASALSRVEPEHPAFWLLTDRGAAKVGQRHAFACFKALIEPSTRAVALAWSAPIFTASRRTSSFIAFSPFLLISSDMRLAYYKRHNLAAKRACCAHVLLFHVLTCTCRGETVHSGRRDHGMMAHWCPGIALPQTTSADSRASVVPSSSQQMRHLFV